MIDVEIIPFDKDREIIVIDSSFSYSEISGNYAEVVSRQYSIYNSSDLDVQNLNPKRLGCRLDVNDYILHVIFGNDRTDIFKKYIPQEKYYIWRSYINLGIHSDNHKIHVDDFSPGRSKTSLVYINRDWSCDWGGETFFYDDERKNVKYVSSFIPGRIVIFDGSIPHSAKPQHFNAPPYRFTLASKFRIHDNLIPSQDLQYKNSNLNS